MLKIRHIILYLLIATAFASCNSYQSIVKKGTTEQKYEAALKYYAKDDFYHAQQLLDELIVLYRGTDKLEQIYYLYAQTYYKQAEYIVASYHFKYFAKTFPKSKFAEECLYLSAYCKYLDSSPSNLDQSSTKEAISEMQFFINVHPTSERVKEANRVMDELQFKLLVKDFEIAQLYIKTEYYKSAVYALNQHIKDFPSSPYKEQALYLIIKANYDYAVKSIAAKQKERFTDVMSSYNDYKAKFPEGEYNKQASRYLHLAQNQIKKIEKKRN